jgi:hypothetical protein
VKTGFRKKKEGSRNEGRKEGREGRRTWINLINIMLGKRNQLQNTA